MNTIIGQHYYVGIKDNLSLFEGDYNIFDKLEKFLKIHKSETKLFFISYDLKNNIELLSSENKDEINFPLIKCVIPDKILSVKDFINTKKIHNDKIEFIPEIKKAEYISIVNEIKDHIQKGDIYETNFCYNWSANQKVSNPYKLYQKLKKLTKAPFGLYAEFDNHTIISASPERFLKKIGNKLISQPIKGTSKRSTDINKDLQLLNKLKNDPKEITENVMIVDLVRNDLSKIAIENSVSVDELCKVYTFENIHQMISTISCEVEKNISFSEILKALFPMGSMTGVPKIKAMQLMEKYEQSKRGLYSGAVGVMQPNGDFDLNVIIRTLVYNKINNSLSFKVGGAITINSIPEKEFEETLVKAEALLKAFNS
jgi:para-aminobenzoate synthetase component 1